MALSQSASQWSHTSLILPLPGGASWVSLLALSEPDTLLKSTSLASISFTGSAPVFPSGHRPPLFTLVNHEKYWVAEGAIRTEHQEPIMVTTPTMPRMKVILEEKVLIDTWMVELQPPPDHVPWGDLEATSSDANYPLTRLVWPLESPTDQIDRIPHTSTSSTRCLRRKDVPSNLGLTTRLPVDSTSTTENAVASDSMNTGSTRNGSQQVTLRALCSNMNTQKTHCLSQSFHPNSSKKHSNLAIRRGHKAFPSLKLQQATAKTDAASFDAIPTAFRGSPLTASLLFDQIQYPLPQNISLAEMLGNLRAKCASLVSLPPDWLYRSRPSRNEISKLSGTVSASHSGEDEWAFAEPLMDMINSFSGTGDDLNAHPILIKDGSLDKPIDSRGRDDVSDTRTIVLANNDAGDTLNSPDFQVGSLTLRPSLIIPSSLRKPLSRSKIKKTVRFVDSVPPPQIPIRLAPDEAEKNNLSTVSPSRHRRGQSISLSTLIPPSPPLSVVRSLQSYAPHRNSWTNRKGSSASPPRPLSHRFPRSPKLPLSVDENLIPQSLNIPPPKTRTYKQALGTIAEPPFSSSASRPLHTSSYLRFKLRGRKGRMPRENLRISAPLPMGTAIPLPKKKDMGVRRSNGKDNVTAPLRSIFMKLK